MANKVPTATAKAHHEVYNLKSRYIAVKIVIFCLFSVSLPDFHHQTNSLFSQWIFFFPIYWHAIPTAVWGGCFTGWLTTEFCSCTKQKSSFWIMPLLTANWPLYLYISYSVWPRRNQVPCDTTYRHRETKPPYSFKTWHYCMTIIMHWTINSHLILYSCNIKFIFFFCQHVWKFRTHHYTIFNLGSLSLVNSFLSDIKLQCSYFWLL